MVDNIAGSLSGLSPKMAGAKSSGSGDTGEASFADILKGAAESGLDVMKQGEKASADAMLGKSNPIDVVTSVSNAEVTLQTAVTIRDKVLAAYQEIMRMSI
jgi:flagellar hook-basal body complex protein FliE